MRMRILLTIITVVVAGQAVFAATTPPLPRPNPVTSSEGWNSFVNSLKIPNLFDRNSFKAVSDPEIRRKIISASNGNCPFMYSNTGSEGLKVYHARSCGRTEEERKKRNGSKCYIPGLQGGSVDARCVNGCCVGINVKYDVSKFVGGNSSVPGTMGSGGSMGGMQQNSLFSSMFQMLGQMFGGGGSGDSYNPQNYNYENQNTNSSVLDKNDTSYDDDSDSLDLQQDQYFQPDSENVYDDSAANLDVDVDSTQSGNTDNQDTLDTVIINNSTSSLVNIKPVNDQSYAFVHKDNLSEQDDDSYNENTQTNGLTDEIILNESRVPEYDVKTEDTSSNDPSATGFKGEKIGQVRSLSLLDRLSMWFASILGLR